MQYPLNKIKKIVQAHQPDAKLSKNVDIMVYHNYLLFMKRLLIESKMKALEMGESTIHPDHIHEVTEKVLQEFRG